MTLRILNIEPEGYSQEARDILQAVGDVDEQVLSKQQLLHVLKDYNVLIIRLATYIDAALLDAAPNLQVIASATTGLNHIDLSAANERTIEVISLKGEAEFLKQIVATAELNFGLIIALLRNIVPAASHAIRSDWNRDLFIGRDLRNKVLGIVGFGRIGSQLAKYANAFGMRVLAYDIRKPVSAYEDVTFCELDGLLSESDIVSLNASFSEENREFFNASYFRKMRPTSLFVNTSRGELVNETDLIEALQKKELAGAALDVLNNETRIPKGMFSSHPVIEYAAENDNLLLTPHIGGASRDSMRSTEVFIARKIANHFVAN